jgi:hypothetical protein
MTGSLFDYFNKAATKAECRYLLLCCHLTYLNENTFIYNMLYWTISAELCRIEDFIPIAISSYAGKDFNTYPNAAIF